MFTLSLLRMIRRLANYPRPEDLSGPSADQLVHKLSFDFNGGKWMYMRVPPETSVPINEIPYMPNQPDPPTLAQLSRRPIVLPDIEHCEKHHATLFKDVWQWDGFWRLSGTHGWLSIEVHAGFNSDPGVNKRDEQQTRAKLEHWQHDLVHPVRDAIAKYTATHGPPLRLGSWERYCETLHIRDQLHHFRGACAIVDEGYYDVDDVHGRGSEWNYYVPISERIVLTLHIKLLRGQGSWTAPQPPNDSWYIRGRQVVAAILDSIEFIGPWPGFI